MIKKILIKSRDKILGWKVNVLRSAGYISFLNLGMLMFVSFNQIRNIDYPIWTLGLVYFFTVIVLGVFGYYDLKYIKGQRVETDYLNQYTPIHPDLKEMKEKVDKLYDWIWDEYEVDLHNEGEER